MSMSSPAAMQVSATLDLSQYESRSRTLVATTQRMAANVNTAMAGISRSVAGSGTAFDRLRASLDPAFAASQRYRQIQQDLAAMVERGDATQRAANIALEQAASRYMGVATAAERAEQVQREQAAAVALSTGQYEALRASLDPVYASSKRYEAATEAMTAAVKNGAITQGQANQVLDMAAQKMLGIAPATKAAASATAAAGTASRGLFASVGGGQNAMKQFAFQLNQVAQQGAVTGNYMQALSVQAADMLTVFGLWGILAGGAIAVLGPLAMSFFGVSDAARSLDDVMGDLSASVGDIKGAIEQAAIPMAALRKEYGDSAEAAKRLYDVQLALGQLKAQNAMQEALEKVRASMGGVIGQVDLYQSLMAQIPDSVMAQNQQLGLSKNITEVLASNYGLTLDGALKAAGAARSMSEALRAGDMDAVARYASEMASSLGAARDASGKIPTDVLETAEAAGQLAVNALQYAGYTEQAERLASGLAINLNDAQTAAQQLASALSSAAAFSASLTSQSTMLGVEIEALKTKTNAANAVMVAGLEARAQATRDAALAAGADIAASNAQYDADMAQIGTIKDLLAQKEKLIESNRTEARSAGSAMRAAERLARQHERELEALRASLDPLEAYRQKLAKLVPLQAALSQDEFARAIRALNVELADSLPLVGDLSDAISTGLVDGFEGGLNSMTDALKSWLKQAIALAMKNQIVIGMGLNGSVSAGGTAAAAATGSALSGIGTAFSALSLGMSNFAGSALSAAWGSISGAFSAGLAGLSTSVTTAFANLTGNLTGLLSGTGGSIASSLGALGSAIGAIAGPVAIIAGLVSFFGTKTKLLDAGIKAVITDTDVLVSTYKRVKKTRFWGLSSSTSTSTRPASAEVADPITQAINATQASILSMASVLGVAADQFDAFAYELKVSTKGLSDEEIGKALAAAMSDAADAYALMIGGLDELIATGETATEALTRLSTALTTVNGAFDTLGYALRYSGLAGAAVSSALEDLLGGADGFTSAVSTYWGTFYSAAEQQAILTRQATTALAAYNAALPRSREEYRALIDAQDLTTEAGRALWAELVGMAGVMDQILPAVSGLTAELEALLGAVSTSLDGTINAVTESQKAAAAAAGQWYKAADSIAEFIRTMRSTSGALVSPTQATAFSQAQYQTRLASALAGDLDAVNGLTGVAQTYLDAVGATAGSATELALAQARVLSDLGTVQGASQIEGARWDVIQGLYQDQVDLMQEVADTLAAGNALSEAQIATLNSQLGSLDDAIAAAAAINYASLQKQIDLSITAVEDAQIPEYLKALLRNADTGITSYVDFVTRSDLTPDLKWLALTGASEMVKTVTYAAENRIGADLTRLAVDTVSTLRKTVHLLAGAGLDAETMQVALAGNSELARVVTATLATDIDAQAKRLALGTVGAYGVSVMASLSPGVSADVRRIVIDEQGSYAALIGATLGADLSADARRILLAQQGRYVANITGVLVSDMDAATRALLLSANTSAARAITLATVYAGSLTAAEIALLRTQATTASATIRAAIDLAGVSATGLLYLAQIGMGSTAVQKTLSGTIALSALSAEARLLLSAVSETVERSVAFRATGSATEDQLRLLGAVSATVLRAVNITATGSLTAAQAAMLGASSGTVQRLLALAATGTLSTDQRSMLAAVSATVTRQLALAAGGALTTDQRLMLLSGTQYVARVIAMQARGVLTDDQRRILTATTGTVERTVTGLVNLSGLTAQQRTFLGAISGSMSGTLTLGGSFRFDPTAAFSTWYEATTEASIAAPMTALRGALGDLAAAVRAETARATHETAVTGLNTYAAGMTANAAGAYFVTDADLAAMAGIIGLDTTGQTALQLRRAIAGYDAADLLSSTIYDPTGNLEAAYLASVAPQDSTPAPASYALSDYRLQRVSPFAFLVTGPLGGRRLFSAATEDLVKDQIASQGFPAFAHGGSHDGGLRLVGENGPELEATGPSRIYTAGQTQRMLGGANDALIAEMQALRDALRAEIRQLRDEQRQLGMQTAENTRSSAKTLRKWDTIGQPPVQEATA